LLSDSIVLTLQRTTNTPNKSIQVAAAGAKVWGRRFFGAGQSQGLRGVCVHAFRRDGAYRCAARGGEI